MHLRVKGMTTISFMASVCPSSRVESSKRLCEDMIKEDLGAITGNRCEFSIHQGFIPSRAEDLLSGSDLEVAQLTFAHYTDHQVWNDLCKHWPVVQVNKFNYSNN
jgi:hypothetical protein